MHIVVSQLSLVWFHNILIGFDSQICIDHIDLDVITLMQFHYFINETKL